VLTQVIPFSQELQLSDGIPLAKTQLLPHWIFSVTQLSTMKYKYSKGNGCSSEQHIIR